MLQLNVSLPSGRSEKLSLLQSSKVGDLRVLAQKSFQLGFLRLVTANNDMLDPVESLQAAGLQEGDHLTAVAIQVKVAATHAAIALWCCGGNRVVAWGSPNSGGDSSGVKDQLIGVQQVHATHGAFAAILADGSVVTWGGRNSGAGSGGDSSGVKDQLKGVQQVHATDSAFAAILADGSVVTWGDRYFGGDSSGVKDQLKGIQQVEGTRTSFVAILADGSVVTWGSWQGNPFCSDGSSIAAQVAYLY